MRLNSNDCITPTASLCAVLRRRGERGEGRKRPTWCKISLDQSGELNDTFSLSLGRANARDQAAEEMEGMCRATCNLLRWHAARRPSRCNS